MLLCSGLPQSVFCYSNRELVWERAQLVKCLLCMYKDLSLSLRTQVFKSQVWVSSVVKSTYCSHRELSSVLSTQVWQFPAFCDSSSRGSDALFWPPWVPSSLMCPRLHTDIQTVTNNYYFFKARCGVCVYTWGYEDSQSPGVCCPAGLTHLVGSRPIRDPVSKTKGNKVEGVPRNDTRS